MPLMFQNGKLLIIDGKLAMSDDCCCCIDTCFRLVFNETRAYVTDRTDPSAVAVAKSIGGMSSSRILKIRYGSTEETLSVDGEKSLNFGRCGIGSAKVETSTLSYFGPPWSYPNWSSVWERRETTIKVTMKRSGIVSFHYRPPLGAWTYDLAQTDWAAATYISSMSLDLYGCEGSQPPASVDTDLDEIGDNPNPYSLTTGYSDSEYSTVFTVG